MRMHNDKRLAETVQGIDIILGGHDHHYVVEYVNNIPILKSGSDFRNFSEISVTIEETRRPCLFDFNKHTITRDIKEVLLLPLLLLLLLLLPLLLLLLLLLPLLLLLLLPLLLLLLLPLLLLLLLPLLLLLLLLPLLLLLLLLVFVV